ncbi:S8 family serine peptidase [Deinococcus peraridilitoris]|uniref:S8 family serine peptidase n=1 Tax=Deinococcus peraridilitoris TaxID=432329 RepID=UPI0012FA24E0|nr:S8 family serine peptidase [Deinococcus peraridilitoris]
MLPNPALPGETLSVIGSFPKNAQFKLGADRVPTTVTAGGASLQLPQTTLAGDHSIQVEGTPLVGNTTVVPRIDAVVLDGGNLTLRGAGWPIGGTLTGVSVDASGRILTPSLVNGQLRVNLGAGTTYGALHLRVNVGGYTSSTFSLLREAATVRGTVEGPAAQVEPAALRSVTVQSVGNQDDLTTLIVRHEPAALRGHFLLGVHRADSLPSLHLTRLAFRTSAEARQAKSLLTPLPGVENVTFDHLVQSDAVSTQGQTTTSGLGKQWFWALQGLPLAWQATQGDGMTVAVIDTGIALRHPDLQDNLLPGYDFVDEDSVADDRAGHGTHVAGLIAANGQVTGAAPKAKLVPVRVLDGDKGGSAFTVAQGILWAAGLLDDHPNPHPAQVINLSLGTPDDSEAMREAVARVQAAGVLVVAATGNSGGALHYPAAYPGVLAVTGVAGPKHTYQPGYASKGPGTGLAAYGGDAAADQDADGVRDGILSTDLANGAPGYGMRMGTSMASPQVAGIAALALSSDVPQELLRSTLLNSATDLGPLGEDDKFGRGLVSARAALPYSPRSYVLALNDAGSVIGWTPVASDGTYALSNLDPAVPVRLLALSDDNNNRVLGEAGELRSSPTATLSLKGGHVLDLPALTFNPSDGSSPVTLEH